MLDEGEIIEVHSLSNMKKISAKALMPSRYVEALCDWGGRQRGRREVMRRLREVWLDLLGH